MKVCLSVAVLALIVFQCCDAVVNPNVKKVITILQGQLDQQNLVTMFKAGGSLAPPISTILQTLPNAEISAFTCFITNINGAIAAAKANTGDIVKVVSYYQGVCNADPNLNAAMAALTSTTAVTQLQNVATKLSANFPAQIKPVATALIAQATSGKAITVAQATSYVKTIQNMNTATKNAIFAKLPSTKAVLNKAGAYYKPYIMILTHLPSLISTKALTPADKKSVNAAIAKMYVFGTANAPQFVTAALNWIKKLPVDAATQSDPTTLANYRTGALKLITNAKMALALPITATTIQQYLSSPYQLP